MRYKLNILSGAALCLSLAMMTAGCSIMDDDDPACPSAQGGDAGNAYISLRFAMPSAPLTRANPDPDGGETGDGQEAGQAEENKISSAVAFLYKADNGVNSQGTTQIAKVIEFTGLGTPGAGRGQNVNGHDIDQTYVTAATEVDGLEYGEYNVIVAANLAENDDSGWWKDSGLTLADVRDHIQTQAWNENTSGYSHFLMTSESDAKVKLTSENTSSETAAECTVDVERVAARIDYEAEAEYPCKDENYKGGKVEILGAAIVNDYKAGSFFLKRVSTAVPAVPTGENSVTYLGNETPVPAGVATNYVIDPHTRDKTSANVGSAAQWYDAYYTTYSEDPNDWAAYVQSGDEVTDDFGGEWNRIGYTLENITPSGDQHAGEKYYNTGVVFKAKFIPASGTVNNSFTKYGYTDGKTFFELGGQLFATMEDMVDWFYGASGSISFSDVQSTLNCSTWGDVKELAGRIPSNDPSGYGAWLGRQAQDKDDATELNDIEKGSLSWKRYMKTVCGYSFSADGGVVLDATDATAGAADFSSTREALAEFGVRTYEDATCYYTWWILHSNDLTGDTDEDNGVEGVMEHAVVRNNIYKLTVSSVYTLGDDVPGSTSLRVMATVNNWVLLQPDEITFGPTQ